MSRIGPTALWLTLLALAGCGHPDPGQNLAASAVQGSPSVPLGSHPTVGQELSAVAGNQIRVTFPIGNAQLTGEAGRQLDVAARLFRDVNPVRMFVSGHSDNRGDEYANLLLSARRAEVVKQGLVARGIPADRLLLQAFGTSEPASPDETQDENRRVTVTWRIL